MNLERSNKCGVGVFLLSLLLSMAVADIKAYVYTQKPELSLVQACKMAEDLVKNKKIDAYPVEVTINGLEERKGGMWNIYFKDQRGGSVYLGIEFPRDRCILGYAKENGEEITEELKRDGSVIK